MNRQGNRVGMRRATTQRKPLFAAVVGALALLAAGQGMAQEQQPAQDSTEKSAVTLDRIVVTANKRVENVREVGASISVIGEQQLENLSANSLSDYADYVPGLQVQDNGAPGLTQVSIRGISALSSGASVATYIDEVPVGSSGLYQAAATLNLDLLPYDIQRIEVLRGPHGTLYGAGAIGGLLKYVTRDPDPSSTEFRVGAGFSSVHGGGDGWSARAGANLPLVDDHLALRVSYARTETPGFTDNAIDGRRNINESTQESARVAVAWTSDAFDAEFTAMRQTIDAEDRSGMALEPSDQRAAWGDLTDRLWSSQPFTKDVDLYSLTLNWDLGWADFVSATGWSRTDTMYQIDTTVQFGEVANLLLGLPDPGSSYVRYGFDLDKLTQEFRLSSKSGGRFEWMVGAFYTKEDAMQRQFAWLGQIDGSPLPAPLDEMFGTLALLELPSSYKETAVFANGSWRITDSFKLDVGARQSRNDQSFSQNVTAGILVPIANTPGESTEDVFTWSVSPQLKLGEDTMLYARAATGYQPGGPNVALPGIPPSVDSSMLASYELGLKSQFADKRVQLDLAAFHIEWDDIQVASSFNGVGGLVNGGEATSEGVELSSLFRATDNLQFGLNAAYTEAEVKNDFEPTVIPQDGFDVVLNTGLGGDRMPYVPKLAWSATAEYAFAFAGGATGQVGAAFRWVGERVNDTTERQRVTAPGDPSTILGEEITPPLELDAYQALDVYAGIGKGGWSFRAYINNVTDERGLSSLSPASGALTGITAHLSAVPIQPRTVGVELDFRF